MMLQVHLLEMVPKFKKMRYLSPFSGHCQSQGEACLKIHLICQQNMHIDMFFIDLYALYCNLVG